MLSNLWNQDAINFEKVRLRMVWHKKRSSPPCGVNHDLDTLERHAKEMGGQNSEVGRNTQGGNKRARAAPSVFDFG